jgi:hypothetical protein
METLECDIHDWHALPKPNHTNLVIQTIFKLEKVEYVLQNLYVYFSHNPKKTQEFIVLIPLRKRRVNALWGTSWDMMDFNATPY